MYYQMFLSTCESLRQGHEILYTYDRCDRRVQALRVTSDRWTRQLMVNYLYFSLNLMLEYTDTLDLAVSGTRCPEIIWRVRRQQWYLLRLFSFV